MLKEITRKVTDPILDNALRYAKQYNIRRSHAYYATYGLAVLLFLCLISNLYSLAMLFLALSYISLGVADRLYAESGGEEKQHLVFLQRVAEPFLAGGFIFFFTLSVGGVSTPGLFLLFAYYLNEASAYRLSSDLAKKKDDDIASKISGLVSKELTVIFFFIMCILSMGFPFFAVIFSFICFASIFGRFMETKLLDRNSAFNRGDTDEEEKDVLKSDDDNKDEKEDNDKESFGTIQPDEDIIVNDHEDEYRKD
jgi:predicted membrane protein